MGRVVLGWTCVCALAWSAGAVAQQDAPGATPAAQTAPAETPAPVPAAPVVQGGTIQGVVTSLVLTAKGTAPGTPLPGVAITALNSLTGKKYTTTTDVDGHFAMKIPSNGRYVVRAELAAFAVATKEAVLNATSHEVSTEFAMELASRAAVREKNEETNAATQSALQGLQSLGVRVGTEAGTQDATANAGSVANTPMPSMNGMDASSADSVSISGQMGQTNGLANFSEDEVRTRIDDAMRQAREQGGSQSDQMGSVVGMLGGLMGGGMGGPGGPGGGGRGGMGGGGGRGGRGGGGGGAMLGRSNFRNFNPAQIHGSLYYNLGNSALDATPFSITGTPLKPGYNSNRYGASFAGSPYIPGLIQPNLSQFLFFNLTGQKDTNPVNRFARVPTGLERQGDFSAPGEPVIVDPTTGTQFMGCSNTPADANKICPSRLNTAALGLLNYYPTATPGLQTSQGYNYQRITTQGSNTTQVAARFIRNLGQQANQTGGGFFQRRGQNQKPTLRQNINVGFNYQHNAADSRDTFASQDAKTATEGYGLNAGYVIGYGRFNNSFTVSWNRSHTLTTNLFTYGATDPGAAIVGTVKPQTVKPGFYYGLPAITLTNYSGFSGTTPADRIQQTISFSDGVSWSHHHHNYHFGMNIRRLHNDVIGGNNGLGSLTFTGYATASSADATGSSFADFLLGAPRQSKIQAGMNKTYLRETAWSAYAQDDFRLRNNLTVNAGLRWEYFAPYVEKYNRLVNLDHSADFTQIATVFPDGTGSLTGRKYPRSLVNPNRTMFSPRLGIAWSPAHLKETVIRAGYGINFNTTQYSSFANSLSYQQPFAVTQTNTAGAGQGCGTFTTGFTITSAFGCTTTAVQNNFAINPNYRLGRVQVVNFDIQKTFPFGIVGNIGYNAAFGSNLDMRRAPNRTASGVTSPDATAFVYEDSIADSRFHSLSVNARKRMSKGISMEATYIYGHSIDNASTVNGSGNNTIPQNDQRLDLEYGNSNFDVRHKVSGDFVAELPFGPNRLLLNQGGFWAAALDGFSVSGNYTLASGSYYTPQFRASDAQVLSGGNFTLRADRNYSVPVAGPGTLGQFFNTAAFSTSAPVSGFGTAARNSIEGPGTVSVSMALSRTQKFGSGTKSVEARMTASNAFNTVQYSSIDPVVNSATYGRVLGVASPRKITFMMRYRF